MKNRVARAWFWSWARLLLPVTVLLGASSCVGLGTKLVPPDLSIVGASMLSADLFSQQFRVRLRVRNPNAQALPIKAIDYQLFLEGDNFAEGVSLASFTVPPLGETEFDMTVKTNFASGIGRLMSRLNGTDRRDIRYDFVGKVVLDKAFSPKIKFSESGSVDLGRK
jgi:LEA14-like dessication related protein